MFHGHELRVLGKVVLVVALTEWAAAQPCQPSWDTTIGNPGISTGYVAPLTPYDDGSGEALYVGGSFPNVAGVGGTQFIARWNRAANTWSSVGGGLNAGSTNGFLTSIVPFQNQLIAGGFFYGAYGVPGTKSLARWNGQAWQSLGAQFGPTSADSVWSLTVWDGVGSERLYIGGSFPTAGGVTAGGLAAWDGTTWYSLGSGIAGSFSPVVFSLTVFDDGTGEALYAAGRFDTVDGVSARLLARWDGTAWSRVGNGLTPTSSLFGLEAMAAFDDGSGPALYVAGYAFIPAGQPTASVAKWDGQTWTTVGQNVGGRVTSLAVFDDGDGPKLYLGGTATPTINYIARLENNQWVPVEGGISGPGLPPSTYPSVFGLGVWGDALYVGGNFTLVNGQPANGLVARQGCPPGKDGDLNCDGVVNAFDIDPFVLALTNPAAYQAQYPNCNIMNADINDDGVINAFDIDPFVVCLTTGNC